MALTATLPWTVEEQAIRKIAVSNKIAHQKLLEQIELIARDEELRSILEEQYFKKFIDEAKNFALELHRYKRMLTTKALEDPYQQEYIDGIKYLTPMITDVTSVIAQAADTLKRPTEEKQLKLKKNVESLHASTTNLANVAGTTGNVLWTGLHLLMGSISAIFAVVLANPLLGLVAAFNFGAALCATNAADDQYFRMRDAKNSFAAAGTNLFSHKKSPAIVSPQPEPEEPKQDPGFTGYPRLNP